MLVEGALMVTEEIQPAESPLQPRTRGRHKIFLGAAPGVGKTFTMLSEAHRRFERGEDILIGIVETHGRSETARQVEGLEQLPRKRLAYRGKVFEEMDTAAVIARHPQWVLVDELAHTNVPGTVHAKRWQSVEEILNAGINVITTVNVQHFESLNETVFEITGVRVRETLPDSILDEADEVVLIDVTPDALINRLKRGDIYDLAKVPSALSNFFRKGNLSALRELALRKTADEVDDKLQEYRENQHIAERWATHDRVMVALTPRLESAKLIRRGYRLSRRMKGTLWCVHVRVPGASLNAKQEAALLELSELARNFGAQVVVLEGEEPANEIIRFAKEQQITFIVMGQSIKTRMQEILQGSVITKIMRETRNIDVLVVADSDSEE
jgi:two-component system sensor histidine kinase KdpD